MQVTRYVHISLVLMRPASSLFSILILWVESTFINNDEDNEGHHEHTNHCAPNDDLGPHSDALSLLIAFPLLPTGWFEVSSTTVTNTAAPTTAIPAGAARGLQRTRSASLLYIRLTLWAEVLI